MMTPIEGRRPAAHPKSSGDIRRDACALRNPLAAHRFQIARPPRRTTRLAFFLGTTGSTMDSVHRASYVVLLQYGTQSSLESSVAALKRSLQLVGQSRLSCRYPNLARTEDDDYRLLLSQTQHHSSSWTSTVPETAQASRPCDPYPARTPGPSELSPLPTRSTVRLASAVSARRASKLYCIHAASPSSSSWKLRIPQLSGSASTS